MRKLIPVIMAILGIALGGGAGWFLKPPPEEVQQAEECTGADCPPPAEHAQSNEQTPEHAEAAGTTEFVKLNNQFIVPDIQNGIVTSLIVLSLSIEVSAGTTEKVYAMEPKLRDMLLQILFDHANAGGFRGDFTSAGKMDALRTALLEASQKVIGPEVRSVLISDIVRQDTA